MEAKEKAWFHFYPEGDGRAKDGFVLHHIDESLKLNDAKRYNEWRVEDLVMITRSEHVKIHHTGRKRSEKTRHRISEKAKGQKKRLGAKLSDETKQKISEKAKGNKWCLGRKLSEETKQKIREANTGKHPSEETRQKLRDAIKGKRLGENHPLYGKHHSEEAKQKMREAHARRRRLKQEVTKEQNY